MIYSIVMRLRGHGDSPGITEDTIEELQLCQNISHSVHA